MCFVRKQNIDLWNKLFIRNLFYKQPLFKYKN